MKTAFVAALLLGLAAPAMAGWSLVGYLDSVITAVQFTDENTGYAAGSGETPVSLLTTTNGALNWTEHGIESGLLPLGVAAAPPNVMVAGVFADNISPDNGKTWGKTTGAHVQSQCLKAANGLFFAVGGQDFGTGQGVVVSTDNGKTFEAKYADCAFTEARYGAFPTKDTWYVTLGSWPETDDESNAVTPARRLAPAGAPRGGWNAQIIGTTDGGNTWTSQYGTNNTEQFYFNEVACESATVCCAAGESDNLSSEPGIRVYCTHDGKTWDRMYYDATGASLMTMASLGNGHFKAGGVFVQNNEAVPAFLTSTDSGKTWTVDVVSNVGEVAILASSFPTASVGYAVGVAQGNRVAVLKWTA